MPAALASLPPRVLVVEDDLRVLGVISDALTECGFECVCAVNDAVAYRELDAGDGPYAALVADINLGAGTTGFDVARRARTKQPALPVVYVTAAEQASIDRFGVGGAELVQKPFAPGELVGAVMRLTRPV